MILIKELCTEDIEAYIKDGYLGLFCKIKTTASDASSSISNHVLTLNNLIFSECEISKMFGVIYSDREIDGNEIKEIEENMWYIKKYYEVGDDFERLMDKLIPINDILFRRIKESEKERVDRLIEEYYTYRYKE
jgi:hypothetical protein